MTMAEITGGLWKAYHFDGPVVTAFNPHLNACNKAVYCFPITYTYIVLHFLRKKGKN